MDQELRKCVWMWAGLLTFRLCDRDYQCAGCPVEALFHPRVQPASTQPASIQPASIQPADLRPADPLPADLEPATMSRVNAVPPTPSTRMGLAASADRFHDPQHLWIRVLPHGRAQIGLDPLAARLLGGASGMELPRAGAQLRRGEPAARFLVEGGKVAFSSPLTGEVLRAHAVGPRRLRSMVSRPYHRAWLMILDVPRLERQLAGLSFGRDVGIWLDREWSRFQEQCFRVAGLPMAGAPVLPDGGEIDPTRLQELTGTQYPALIGHWIGQERFGRTRTVSRSFENAASSAADVEGRARPEGPARPEDRIRPHGRTRAGSHRTNRSGGEPAPEER